MQIARHHGAEVFGTASPSKHDAIRELGVEHAIDYRSQDFEQEVRRITGGEGVDVRDRRHRPDQLPQGLPPAPARAGGWSCTGSPRRPTGTGRDLRSCCGSLARMPFATMPWWKSLQLMSENKGVFGLNMLHWWDRRGRRRPDARAR